MRTFRAGFLFCGLGLGARGFIESRASLGDHGARFVSVGGAFNDPECWVADARIPGKLIKSLSGGVVFYCHRGLEVVDNKYQVPRTPTGEIDYSRLTLCAGYAAVSRQPRTVLQAARYVSGLRLQMIRRWLGSDTPSGKRLKRLRKAVANLPVAEGARMVAYALTRFASDKRKRVKLRREFLAGQVSE